MIARLALAVIGLLAANLVHAADPLPLETFGKLPTIERVSISPDGSRLATVVTNGEQRHAVVFSLPAMTPIIDIPASESKLRDIGWIGPDHLIAEVSQTTSTVELLGGRREWFFGLDYDLAHRTAHRMMDKTATIVEGGMAAMNAIGGFNGVRVVNDKTYVYVEGLVFREDHSVDSLFRYDPTDGQSVMVALGEEHTSGWVVDAAGHALAQSTFDARAKKWTLDLAHGPAFRTVKTVTADIEHPELVGLGREPDSLLIYTEQGYQEWVRDAQDWSEPLFDRGDEPLFDPVSDTLIGYRTIVGDDDRYVFYRPADQQMWNAAKGAYPGASVDLVSFSADRKKWVLSVDSPTDGPAYAIVDFEAHKGKWIGGEYLQTTDWVAPVQPVTYKAADGLELHGCLTLPRGRTAKNLPLIVFPHGGPAARDYLGFDWWAQVMASRGYAVLQVNYRGSDGYGWEFQKAGFGEYGRKMQTDLSDGVRHLVSQGQVDPRRVCIVGASYGGYAAMAGITLDSSVYRCAVAVAGISDEKRMVKQDAAHKGVTADRYWRRYIGAENDDDPRFDAISPIKHVDKVTAPLLLIHGKDDTVVPYEQSQIMFDALKNAGKTVDMVTLSHEDDWLTTGGTRLEMLQAIMAFLANYNPAD